MGDIQKPPLHHTSEFDLIANLSLLLHAVENKDGEN